ncbi:UNVERIFIED_CONTAM: hypothetical protein FKN15_018814 [Acipenser sinensis]
MLGRPKPGDSEEDLLRYQDRFLASGGEPGVQVVRRPDKRRGEPGTRTPAGETEPGTTRDIVSMDEFPEQPPPLTPAPPQKKSRFRSDRVRFEKDDPAERLDREDPHLTAVLSRIIASVPRRSIFAQNIAARTASAVSEPSQNDAPAGITGQRLAPPLSEKMQAHQTDSNPSFDPRLVSFVKSKKSRDVSGPARSQEDRGTEGQMDTQTEPTLSNTEEGPIDVDSDTEGRDKESEPPVTVEDLPVKPQEGWVHMNQLEPEKLEWIKDLPKPRKRGTRQAMQARFDFSGSLIPPEADLPPHLGLHHHGEEPQQASVPRRSIFAQNIAARTASAVSEPSQNDAPAGITGQRLAPPLSEKMQAHQTDSNPSFDPRLVSFVKSKKSRDVSGPARSQEDRGTEGQMDTQTEPTLSNTEEGPIDVDSDTEGRDKESEPPVTVEDLPVKPQEGWVHMNQLEPEKLEWIKDLPKPRKRGTRQAMQARFDFSGSLIPPEADLPPHLGLHHHGEEPQARSGHFASLLRGSVLSTLLDAGLLFLLRFSLDDSVGGVMAAAVHALWALLVAPDDEECLDSTFSWLQGGTTFPLLPSEKPEEDEEEEGEGEEGLNSLGLRERLSRYLALEPQDLLLEPREAVRLSTEALRLWSIAAGYGQACDLYRELYPILVRALQCVPSLVTPPDPEEPLHTLSLHRAEALRRQYFFMGTEVTELLPWRVVAHSNQISAVTFALGLQGLICCLPACLPACSPLALTRR